MQSRYDQVYSGSADRARYAALRDRLRAMGRLDSDIRLFSAPGRTELGGNHTDHQNGKVLAAAVDVDTIAAVADNGTDRIRFHSAGFPPCELSIRPEENREVPPQSTAALLAGMIAMFAQKCELRGLDICAQSTVLPGSGLSSSASVEVLLACVLNRLFSAGLSAVELAKIGQRVENVYFGKPCGLLDQAASAVGGVSYMDFRDSDAPSIEKLCLDLDSAGYALFLIDCGASHADLTEEYASIPREMKRVCAAFGAEKLSEVEESVFYAKLQELRSTCSDRAILRAMHIFDENRRVDAMRSALMEGNFPRYLDLVRASGLSSWRFLQNIAPSGSLAQPMALTLAVCEKILDGRGACRVHGGGFAGTAQAYVPLELADRFPQALERLLPSASCMRRRIRAVGASEILL